MSELKDIRRWKWTDKGFLELDDNGNLCEYDDVKKILDNKDKEIERLKQEKRNDSCWGESSFAHIRWEICMSELKEKLDLYKRGWAENDKVNAHLYAELRHSNYQRCLAMARIAQDDWHLHNSFYSMGHQEFEKHKCEFYEKWHKRWLELAEKFKPNKEAK